MGCGTSSTNQAQPHDEAKERELYEENPEQSLPEGEVGNCMLGVNVRKMGETEVHLKRNHIQLMNHVGEE